VKRSRAPSDFRVRVARGYLEEWSVKNLRSSLIAKGTSQSPDYMGALGRFPEIDAKHFAERVSRSFRRESRRARNVPRRPVRRGKGDGVEGELPRHRGEKVAAHSLRIAFRSEDERRPNGSDVARGCLPYGSPRAYIAM